MEQLHNSKQFGPPVPNIIQKLLNNHNKNNFKGIFLNGQGSTINP